MSTVLGTFSEIQLFLVLNKAFASTLRERVWHYWGWFVETLTIILLFIVTQLLFVSSPSIQDQLLNCVALTFLVEVDNSVGEGGWQKEADIRSTNTNTNTNAHAHTHRWSLW